MTFTAANLRNLEGKLAPVLDALLAIEQGNLATSINAYTNGANNLDATGITSFLNSLTGGGSYDATVAGEILALIDTASPSSEIDSTELDSAWTVLKLRSRWKTVKAQMETVWTREDKSGLEAIFANNPVMTGTELLAALADAPFTASSFTPTECDDIVTWYEGNLNELWQEIHPPMEAPTTGSPTT